MPHDKGSYLATQGPKELSVRAALVHRGLQEIAKIQQVSPRVAAPKIDASQLNIVITVNTWWIVRADRFPGKIYVMFGCDIENNSDGPQRLGKEMAICSRSKTNGEVSHIGDAILLPFSPELVLPPQSATSLDLELEIDSPEEKSSEDHVYAILSNTHDLLGYDYTFGTAILIFLSAAGAKP